MPAKRGPGHPRKRPRPVDMDDGFVQTWYASVEKEIQEALNVAKCRWCRADWKSLAT